MFMQPDIDGGAIVTFGNRIVAEREPAQQRCVPLGGNQPLDLGHRVRGQFLRNLGGDAIGNLRVKGPAEITQDFRRRDDDELLEAIGVSMAIERLGKLVGEPFLCKVMPVDFFHGTPGDAKTGGGSSRTIGALLSRRRIIPLKDSLDNEMDAQCIASVAQE